MKKISLFLILILFVAFVDTNAQNFIINATSTEFDGYKLSVTYDLIAKNKPGRYSLWIEIKRQNGNPIRANSIKGDVGDSISPGKDKIIVWIPEDDGVFINENVTIEIKGEEYVRSFEKGSMVLLSTAMPGLGQSRISKGKPYWIAGIAAYGTLAGGLIVRGQHNQTILDYENELDPIERSDLWNESQQQKKLADVFFVSAGVIWIGNLVWVAATPNRYKPLQHTKLSLYPSYFDNSRITMVTLRHTF